MLSAQQIRILLTKGVPNLEAFLSETFPYTSRGAGSSIVCNDCAGNGWGPMLTSRCWDRITTVEEQKRRSFFLCGSCQEKRLGRRLNGYDLRDCPMNYLHPQYTEHGLL